MEYMVMVCYMEEFLPRIAKNEESLMAEIKKDRSLIDGLLDIIRGIKNNLAIKWAKSEKAMLDEAERNLVNLLRIESGEQSIEKRNSVKLAKTNTGIYEGMSDAERYEILKDK